MVTLDLNQLHLPADATYTVEDLLTNNHYTWQGPTNDISLTPAATAHIFRIVSP